MLIIIVVKEVSEDYFFTPLVKFIFGILDIWPVTLQKQK